MRLPLFAAPCAAALFSSLALAQTTLLTIDGGSAGARLGHSVSGAGDVDDDGYQDIVVGSYGAAPNGAFSGRVIVISGRTSNVLYTFDGDSADDMFGAAVAGAGDVNGDGKADIIVGAPRDDNNGADSGNARVLSGEDGSVLYSFDGDSPGDLFGWSVDGAGDVDGDGFDDLIVGAVYDDNTTTDAGSVTLFSGEDGSVIRRIDGTKFEQYFGWSVAGLGDFNADGFEDYAIGTHADDANGLFSGSVWVYSGRDGVEVYQFSGDGALAQFGVSVGGAGDVDRDGFGDIVVGAVGDDTNGFNSGLACVFSGFDGSTLYTFRGDSAFDAFGHSVDGAGDLDGDGHDDLVVGAPGDDNSGVNAGSVRAFSGADGSTLFTMNGGAAGDELGSSVAGLDDVNSDGYREVVLGAERASNAGADAGRALVVGLGLAGQPPKDRIRGRACPGSSGNLPRVRVIDRAFIDGAYTIGLRGALPGATAVMNIGISWNLDLTLLGAPGCVAYAYPILSSPAPTNGLGFASGALPLPNDPGIVGVRLHNSFLILDAAANTFGVVASNDATMTVGQ